MEDRGLEPDCVSDDYRKDLGNPPSGRAAKSGAAGAPKGPDDPNLAIIIQRWPDLPPAMKSGILAMVQATSGA